MTLCKDTAATFIPIMTVHRKKLYKKGNGDTPAISEHCNSFTYVLAYLNSNTPEATVNCKGGGVLREPKYHENPTVSKLFSLSATCLGAIKGYGPRISLAHQYCQRDEACSWKNKTPTVTLSLKTDLGRQLYLRCVIKILRNGI